MWIVRQFGGRFSTDAVKSYSRIKSRQGRRAYRNPDFHKTSTRSVLDL